MLHHVDACGMSGEQVVQLAKQMCAPSPAAETAVADCALKRSCTNNVSFARAVKFTRVEGTSFDSGTAGTVGVSMDVGCLDAGP